LRTISVPKYEQAHIDMTSASSITLPNTPHADDGEISSLKDQIEQFVEAHLPNEPTIPKTTKVVHDGLWGTIRLSPAEIAFIDTPLVQRLRSIAQTGPAYFVYPSTRHSRFEHSLGVMLQVQRLADALRQEEAGKKQLNDENVAQMRFGALFHDVGHGPFSHTSEVVYGAHPALQALRKLYGNFGSPHEILSRLIVESKPFKLFADKVAQKSGIPNLNIDMIARAITGQQPVSLEEKFVSELLNGPFDADKLDYFFRDSHFSGIPLAVDVERLLRTVRIVPVEKEGGAKRLVVSHGGAGTLEQILFAKMVLHTSVYQHHKIRSFECLFHGMIEYIQRCREHKSIPVPLRNRRMTFESPVDYLWTTDETFRHYGFLLDDSSGSIDGPLHRMVHGLYFRRPLVRALVLSEHTVKKNDSVYWKDLLCLDRKYDILAHQSRREIAKEILQRANVYCLPEEVWLDLPALPNSTAANDIYVAMPGSRESNADLLTLNELFPLETWVGQYGQNKWRGHVFCPREVVEPISRAAKTYFEEKYGVIIKREAFDWCKQTPP